MRLTRREFTKLLALGLGAGAAVAGLPGLAGRAAAAGKPSPPAGSLDPALPLHPLLQYGARVEPDKVVRVIVQQARAGDDGRAIAAAHGARHLEEFAFVKTHHLEIKQGLLPGLARDPHVLHVAPDGPVQKHAISTKNLQTVYPLAIGADKVWNGNPAATGRGVAVAVLDTGLNAGLPDFTNPGSAGSAIAVNVNPRSATADDAHGHGTHVAGIVKGRSGTGGYIGIAPDCTLLSVKIADDSGVAHEADMLRGLQWVYDNRAGYGGSGANRVVNLSVSI
jgi:subtilisin family serine protease